MSAGISPELHIADGVGAPIRMAFLPATKARQAEWFADQPNVSRSQIVILVTHQPHVFVTIPDIVLRHHDGLHRWRRCHCHRWRRLHHHRLEGYPPTRFHHAPSHQGKSYSRHCHHPSLHIVYFHGLIPPQIVCRTVGFGLFEVRESLSSSFNHSAISAYALPPACRATRLPKNANSRCELHGALLPCIAPAWHWQVPAYCAGLTVIFSSTSLTPWTPLAIATALAFWSSVFTNPLNWTVPFRVSTVTSPNL